MSDGDRRFVVGLIGADLGPSLSPALHEREADEHGLRYVYQRIDLDVLGLGAEDVGDLVRQARRLGFAGLNITHPCKQTVVKHLDQLSPDATALGAVNTVVFGQRGTIGHNTDWSGFAAGFKRGLADARVDHIALLGAGGAGTAVAYAIARLGARRLTVVDVVLERAELLEFVLSHAFPGSGDDEPIRIEVAHSITEIADSLTSADGLINATPIGMTRPEEVPLPDGFLRPEMWVADVIYRPLETELLRRAREIGCRTLNGGGMVVFQAAEAFRLITGEAPDADRMYAHFTSMTRGSPAAQPVGS